MQLNEAISDYKYQITSYNKDKIIISGLAYTKSIAFTPDSLFELDYLSLNGLSLEVLNPIISAKPDILLLGTGDKFDFLPTKLTAQLQNIKLGVETMDNNAVCRTYVALASEGRRVAAVIKLPA